MKKKNIKKIGILGGSFDPAHKGHIKISVEAKKNFKINKIIWAITKKNPFKKKHFFNLKKRILIAKKLLKSIILFQLDFTKIKLSLIILLILLII